MQVCTKVCKYALKYASMHRSMQVCTEVCKYALKYAQNSTRVDVEPVTVTSGRSAYFAYFSAYLHILVHTCILHMQYAICMKSLALVMSFLGF